MSIAVSALVRPSRALRILTLLAGLAQLAAGCALALGAPAGYRGASLFALAPALAGTMLLACAVRRPKPHRIDISGTGALRVTVQQGVDAPEQGAAPAAILLPGSVVWPVLMLLRCRVPAPPRARTLVVLIGRDSVDGAAWRALAVALAAVGQGAGNTETRRYDELNSAGQ